MAQSSVRLVPRRRGECPPSIKQTFYSSIERLLQAFLEGDIDQDELLTGIVEVVEPMLAHCGEEGERELAKLIKKYRLLKIA